MCPAISSRSPDDLAWGLRPFSIACHHTSIRVFKKSYAAHARRTVRPKGAAHQVAGDARTVRQQRASRIAQHVQYLLTLGETEVEILLPIGETGVLILMSSMAVSE